MGAPVPGGSAARSGGRLEGTADSVGASQEGASGAGAAAEPGGVESIHHKLGSGRSGCAACVRSGAGQGGRCGEALATLTADVERLARVSASMCTEV